MRYLFLTAMLALAACGAMPSGNNVQFPLGQNLAQPKNAWYGKQITLTGSFNPAAKPFSPAIILMSGGYGLEPNYAMPAMLSWAHWFHERGFNTLIMDSNKPRGLPDNIENTFPINGGDPNNWFNEHQRSEDVLSAYHWLFQQPSVDPKKVYVMGFSHGGGAVMEVWARPEALEFAGLIDFYGNCHMPEVEAAIANPATHTTPLLVLVGGNDGKLFVDCSKRLLAENLPTVHGEVFTGVAHAFDRTGPQYNGNAVDKSKQMIEQMIEK